MRHTLLIIDDEPSIQKILAHFLGKEYEVITKGDGLEAKNWLESGMQADLVIADLNMPEMGGFELIQHIRADAAFLDVPILVLSGEESSADRIKCLEMGADDYIVKPFNPQEVKARVKNILQRIRKA